MLYRTLLFFLRDFISLFKLFPDFWDFLTALFLLPRRPPRPSLMNYWLDLCPKQFSDPHKFILALGHSILLVQHTVTLRTFMLGGFIETFCGVVVHQSLIIVWNLCARISVRIARRCLRGHKSFYLIRSLLLIIYIFHGGQDVTPFLVGKRVIVLVFIAHFIIYGYWKAVPSYNLNLIFR